MLTEYLYVFLISMVPVVELRGAIPIGVAMGLDPWLTFAVAVIGNCLPVPFILLFIRAILRWMKTTKHLAGIANWLEAKAEKNSGKVLKYATFGLFLFVAIPFPGTGAWTGSLIAALFDMRRRYAIPSVFLGVIAAGVVMTLASAGVVAAFDFFL